MRRAVTRTLLIFTLPAAFAATAQISREDARAAHSTRHAVFELLSFNMAPLAQMSRGLEEFDAELAARNARRVQMLAGMIPETFETDTRPAELEESRANPILWDNFSDFADRADDLAMRARELEEAAQSGDQRAFAQAVRTTGQACGACHDLWRLEE